MPIHTYCKRMPRMLLLALPLALALVFLLPATSEAHAILLKSNPGKGETLTTPPAQVQMFFSEDLNPATSSAAVVNGANQRVDTKDAHVPPDNAREMDLSLQPDLAPGVYVVFWRSQSADDGHVLAGSFIFKIQDADGNVPQPTVPITGNPLNGGSSSTTDLASGQLDATSIFSFIMITLADLGAIFWMGAQLWRTFVLQLADTGYQEQSVLEIEHKAEQRFDLRFSLPTLILLLIANLGVLVGQALALTGGNWGQALAPNIFFSLISSGRFGTYWSVREIAILLAIVIAVVMLLVRKRSQMVNSILPWINLLLGLTLLIAMTLSGHAAATSTDIMVYAVLVDWLHLLAASLWIGGMLYIALIYLPILKGRPATEQTGALLSMLPRFSPLAITGVIIMAVTGPFNGAVHMTAWDQLLTTAYGRTLDIKVLLVAGLLLTSSIHVGLFRPQLEKDYKQYQAAQGKPDEQEEKEGEGSKGAQERSQNGKARETSRAVKLTTEETKLVERSVARQTKRMTTVLRWEPLLGVAVLLCTGLLNVFAGTLQPATSPNQPAQPPAVQSKPFTATASTTDKLFTFTINVTPNRFGTNVFTVKVTDSKGNPTTNVGVTVYTRMLDMEMGTDAVNLQPDNKGGFSASGDLSMGGHWELRIQIRTPDNKLHETKLTMLTSF